MQSSLLRNTLRRATTTSTRFPSASTSACPACCYTRSIATSPFARAPTLDRTPISTPATAPPPPLIATNAPAKSASKARVIKARKAALTLVSSRVLLYCSARLTFKLRIVADRGGPHPLAARLAFAQIDSDRREEQGLRGHVVSPGVRRQGRAV